MNASLGHGTVDGLPFTKVLGSSRRVGKGELYAYVIYVEDETDVNPREFARMVKATLGDSRSWIKGGNLAFQRVESGGNTSCVLATPDTVDKLCAPLDTAGEVSCCVGSKVVINSERWKHAVPHWTGSVESYRQMVINHEWGHRTGHGHGYCAGAGKVAPVMQQQTYGLQGCRRNSWPKNTEL